MHPPRQRYFGLSYIDVLVLSSVELNPPSPAPISDELVAGSSGVSDADGVDVVSSAISVTAEVDSGAALRVALGRGAAFRLAAAFFLVLFPFAATTFFFATLFFFPFESLACFPFFPLFLALALAIRLALISTYS